ncbi:MAG: putative transporter transrane protein [Acidimicrobiaceae bacterium]|nr:putative transporter transrane protein [Acidimicrobiaceae bacterium]
MSRDVSLGSVVRSEWIKFRSVRSTVVGVVVTLFLTLGLGALVTVLTRLHWNVVTPLQRATFDPVSTSLVGVLFAQFAVGVIGSLFVTSEFSTGSIRTTLSAVPKRYELALGKLIVLVASMFVIGEVASFATFSIGQAIFSGVVPTASLSNSSVLRAVVFAGLYLTLLSVLAFSLGLLLRQSAACISVYVSILLIIPIIALFLPTSWQDDMRRFLPSEMGHAMISTASVPNNFGATTSLVVLVGYVAALFAVGVVVFTRRDA